MPENHPAESAPPPTPTLTDLILSLAAAALTQLGHQVASEGPKPQPNLQLARHTIDTIEMLKVKTDGNRTSEENVVLEQLLYQLRMAWIEAGATNPPPGGTPPEKRL